MRNNLRTKVFGKRNKLTVTDLFLEMLCALNVNYVYKITC
jgi:hypothetical protein